MEPRKVVDCRKMPSENNCQLTMAGPEDDLVEAAVDHVVQVHGHKDSPQLREDIINSLEDEVQENEVGRTRPA